MPDNFGPIYVNGGNVDLKGAFSCDGCTIVLTNQSSSPTATIGTLSSNAQATNNIKAPTTGPFAGIAVYQDPRATGKVNKINGGSNSVITGALYFPKDVLWINGNGTASALCTMFIARRIVFTGTSGIALQSLETCGAAAGLPAGSTARMVRLVA